MIIVILPEAVLSIIYAMQSRADCAYFDLCNEGLTHLVRHMEMKSDKMFGTGFFRASHSVKNAIYSAQVI